MLVNTSKFRVGPPRRHPLEASVAKVKTLPWLQSHVETCGKKALGKKAADGRGKFGGTSWQKLRPYKMDVDSDPITMHSAGI